MDDGTLGVRAVRAADASAVAALYVVSSNAAFAGHLPAMTLTDARIERWRRDLSQPAPHHWWVAERDGRMVGFAGIGPSRDPAEEGLGELDTIAVDPACWRQGIGRALMDAALARLASDGYRAAILWTLAGYGRARGFYLATGWRLDGRTRDAGRQVLYRHDLGRRQPPGAIRPAPV